ncbi:hypothetical protein [Massilia soli]|uniref:BON domain-containing protein n=1 Tax=Massilia soli TaxID=2792854 RepID=A0ABS7SUR1_9BURK|nr:hypothetical protein [Massilia soli]MBZ2209694.1 hypothetical protein [Massilia soli]
MTSSSRFDPFSNEAQVVTIGKLMVENRLDRVTLSGDVDLTADQAGLALALELHALIGSVVRKLQARPLPAALPPALVKTVGNPFAD